MFIKQCFLLISQLSNLGPHFIHDFIVLFIVRLLEQLFRFIKGFGLNGDLIFVPVEDWSGVSSWALFLGPLNFGFSFFVILLFVLSFFLYFLLVLWLFIQGLARINESLFNILLRHVFWHIIIIYRRVDNDLKLKHDKNALMSSQHPSNI